MLVWISVLYSHCSRFLETLESIPMYLYSTIIFCLSICFSCDIKLTKLNPICVFDVVANTKRVNASMTRCQYFLWWSVFIQSSYCVNVKRFVHRSNLLQKYLLFHLELCVCHVSPCNVTLFANSWILDVNDVNGVKFKITFEIPICVLTDSSLFSCHYQCQLLTKLNLVVVFDVVAHTNRVNRLSIAVECFVDPLTVSMCTMSNISSVYPFCFEIPWCSVLGFVFNMFLIVTLLFSPNHK